MYVLSTAPSPVRHIEPIAINSSSINITWNVPAEPNGIVSYHVIVVSHKSFNTSDTFLVINGLKPFTKYYIHVQPYTRAGFGDKSTGYSATTLESSMLFLNICTCIAGIHLIYSNYIDEFAHTYSTPFLSSRCVQRSSSLPHLSIPHSPLSQVNIQNINIDPWIIAGT